MAMKTRELFTETVTLSGIWHTIVESNRKELEAEDLREPLPWFEASKELEDDALRRWAVERPKLKDGKKRWGWVVVMSQVGPLKSAAIWGLFASGMQGLLGTVGRFLVLRAIIRASKSGASKMNLTGLAILFFFISALEGIMSVFSRQFLAGHLIHGLMARNNSLLLHKVSKVSAATSTSGNDRSVQSMPSLSALYAADIPRMLSFVRYLSLLAAGVTSLIGGTVIVAIFLGIGAVVALGCMLIVGFLQQYYTQEAKRFEPKVFDHRDTVVAAIKQSIKAIKAVKFYAWEDQYAEVVRQRRKTQGDWMVKYRLNLMASISTGKAFPVVATVATLVSSASLRRSNRYHIDAEDAFSALAVFATIRVGMIIVPLSRVLFNTFLAIHDRIASFLEAPEDQAVFFPEKKDTEVDLASIRDLRATLGAEQDDERTSVFTLTIDEMKIGRGQLVALVGQVGSGKTALSHAFLGRLSHTGTVEVYTEVVGYAPQEPFVVSGTVAENIVMGRDYEEDLLEKAVRIASMDRDISLLSHGVDTIIGERGTTLSGGQQARLQVARAVYGDPELLVLDSSLAAVDAKVARDMFDAIRQWCTETGGSCILVVSQLHFLPECDIVVVLEDGEVVARGTASDVVSMHDGDGPSFLAHLVRTLRDGIEDESVELPSSDDEDDVDRKAAFMTEKTVRKIDVLPSTKKIADDDDETVLVKKEKIRHGAISLRIFRAWCRGVGYGKLVTILGVYYFASFMLFGSDIILAQWTRAKTDRSSYMAAYAAVALFHLPCLLAASMAGVVVAVAGADKLHASTFDTVLRAPVAWFDSIPSGRIVSRFAADFDIVDIEWAQMLDGFVTMFTAWSMYVLAICSIVPMLIPINAFAFYGLVRSLAAIDVANRDLKRIANAAVSPCVTTSAEIKDDPKCHSFNFLKKKTSRQSALNVRRDRRSYVAHFDFRSRRPKKLKRAGSSQRRSERANSSGTANERILTLN